MIGWSSKQAVWKLFPLFITISYAMDVYVTSLPLIGDSFHASHQALQATLYLPAAASLPT